MIAKYTSIRVRIIFFVLLFITSVYTLDTLVFYKLAYSFPNEMEWDTSHWYNFQHSRTNMIPFPEERKGVLVVGSSVALYSVLPKAMEDSLSKNGENISVRFYSHVAMSPSDFYNYTEDIISKNPELVIYLLNPGDFQLDYFPEDNLIPFEFDLDKWMKGNIDRQPVRSFYPFNFVLQNYKEINRESLFLLLTKSMLYVNRERSFILDPFYAYYEKHFRSGRSYHNYTGITPKEGIWRKGWTLPKFSVECEKPVGSVRKELIYVHHPNTMVRVSTNNQELLSLTFPSSGWKEIQIPFAADASTMGILIETEPTVSSRTIDPKSYAREEFYGIRLSQNFCRNVYQRNIALDRRESLEDISLSNMSLEEYQADYFNKLMRNAKNRPELYRQNHIREVKINLSKTKFTPWIEFEYLRKGLLKLKDKNIKVILITNPENPLETGNYVPSIWYSGFDEYMHKISQESNSLYMDKILFLKDPRYFLDVNHLTYSGAEWMSKEYVNLIHEKLHE